MASSRFDLKAAATAWRELCRALGGFSLTFDAANLAHMEALLGELLEAGGGKDAAASDLLAAVSDWIEAYESANVDIPEADPVDTLRHLLDENGLRQVDVADLLGGQSVVSAILNRKRQINAQQAFALANRFGVSPMVFLADRDASIEPASAIVLVVERTISQQTAADSRGRQLAIPVLVDRASATSGAAKVKWIH